MGGQEILVYDPDPRSLNMIEVYLRRERYSVRAVKSREAAISTLESSRPALLLLSDTDGAEGGLNMLAEIRQNPAIPLVPVIFMSGDRTAGKKMKALETGAADFITRPVFMRELARRISLILDSGARPSAELDSSTGFIGNIAEIGLPDVLQTILFSRRSGVITIDGPLGKGAVHFRDGAIVDAELNTLGAERAFYRLLLWREGIFRTSFVAVTRQRVIKSSVNELLIEGMRRVDEWARMMSALPGPDSAPVVNVRALREKLASLPDDALQILRLADGSRSFLKILDLCEGDDLEILGRMIMLGDAGILAPAAGKADQAPDREGEKGAPAPETGSGGASVVEVEQEPVAPKPQPDVLRGRILLKPPYMIGVSVARRPASGWRRAVWLAVPLILAGALAAFGGRDLIGFAGDAAGRIANGVQHVIKSFKAQEHKNGH